MGTGTLRAMDEHIPAEELPTLYRAVLETVARLERAGERSFAFAIRQKAVRAYSTRWDEGGRRTLIRLDRDAQSRLEATRRAVARGAVATTSEPA
jgi:hypothetical protein